MFNLRAGRGGGEDPRLPLQSETQTRTVPKFKQGSSAAFPLYPGQGQEEEEEEEGRGRPGVHPPPQVLSSPPPPPFSCKRGFPPSRTHGHGHTTPPTTMPGEGGVPELGAGASHGGCITQRDRHPLSSPPFPFHPIPFNSPPRPLRPPSGVSPPTLGRQKIPSASSQGPKRGPRSFLRPGGKRYREKKKKKGAVPGM